MYKALKGMPDLLPGEVERWQVLESEIRSFLDSFAYREIRTPIMENTALFSRSIGDATDIVEKEMFTFVDKNGSSITLRPEGTAAALRAYNENHLHHGAEMTKLYYLGPMFRHERPQKGRLRQFHQVGIEAIGSAHPLVDVEVVALLVSLLKHFDIPALSLHINSVGDRECRPTYEKKLVSFLEKNQSRLCENCVRRLKLNPLRVLDCKVPDCQTVLTDAPMITDHLCQACSDHFTKVQEGLKAIGVPFKVNPKIVRGLDYYVRTAFEVTAEGLGAQNVIGAGGRYDGLIEELGGPNVPAIGFAVGLERVLLAALEIGNGEKPIRIDVIPIEKEAEQTALKLSIDLRISLQKEKVKTSVDLNLSGGSLKSALRKSNKDGSRYAVLIGSREMEKQTVVLKDLQDHGQQEVPMKNLPDEFRKRLT